MPNTDSGFKVDPDALDSVADMIQNLLDDLSGAHGRVAGSVPEFAKCADIGTALATFWGTLLAAVVYILTCSIVVLLLPPVMPVLA